MKEVVIIGYKTGNVDSVFTAIKFLGFNPVLTSDKKIIEKANRIILPGQGSFDHGMIKINELGLYDLIKFKILNEKVPTLGICLGMHLLATYGYENNVETKGLNCIKGKVKKLNVELNLPHIGWNENYFLTKDNILENIKDRCDFYFAHSYYFECEEKYVISNFNYGNKFPSIINCDNIYGVQFHPEKSLKNGLNILKNFLNT